MRGAVCPVPWTIVDTCADGWAQAENIAAALEPASPSVPTSAADK